MTAADVQTFAGRHFDPGQASVVVVGDAKAFAAPLKTARPDLDLIPVDQLDLDSPTLRKAAK